MLFLRSLKDDAPTSHARVDVDVIMPPVVVTEFKTHWMPIPPKQESNNDKHNDRLFGRLSLEQHRYRSDGLLEVNPDGAHPIFELIRNAQAAWDAKLKRSSKTLAEAVAEYKRRYKRLPPRGFDDWYVHPISSVALTERCRWTYVQQHDVELPDEYDQIYEDLEPFWGMDPRDLQRIQFEWEAHFDTYTIGKTKDGPMKLVNSSLAAVQPGTFDLRDGAYMIIDLLKDVEDKIPPFRAIFSPHDNPNLHTDWELRDQALQHAAAGTCTYLLLVFSIPPNQHSPRHQ